MILNSRAQNINLYTVIAVYFLILVGGIVRSMGAGMGCPDWPKCFDSYIPPVDESVLPQGYESYYVEARQKKNARLSNVLSTIGFDNLAARVKNDPSIQEVTKFDTKKAWVEYINRLVGVVIGFLILLNTYFSFRYWNVNRKVPILALFSLLLVLFQGWIGSLVVSTNLLPGFISFHMLLALLLVALLLGQRFLMTHGIVKPVRGRGYVAALLLLFLIQIVFGVEVREQIDMIKHSTIERADWIESLGALFYIHRSYSLILIGLVGYIYYINRSQTVNSLKVLVGMVTGEILLGAIMAYFAVPAAVQPLHLLFAAVAFGAVFSLFLNSYFKQIQN